MTSRRHIILIILFCGYILCYFDRMVIASAIPVIGKEFGLLSFEMGAVLSAFFLGYTLMQLPGGLMADRFGPKRILITSVILWSAFTALTGAATGFVMLLAVRILFGLSEGPFPPSGSKLIATWFPRNEIGRANGAQLAAVNIGAALAPLAVAPMLASFGWRTVFYSLLIPGLLFAVVLWKVVVDAPSGPGVCHENTGSPASKRALVKTPAILWCAIALFLGNLGSWGLMNWLPAYLLEARGFSLMKMGLYAPLPFIAGAIGYYFGGHISDRYFSEHRRIVVIAGMACAGIMTYFAAVSSSGEWAVVALSFVFLSLFTALSGLFSLPLVVVPPEDVGTAFGIVNTAGQAAAFLSPLAVGAVLDMTGKNYSAVFFMIMGFLVMSACAAIGIRTQH